MSRRTPLDRILTIERMAYDGFSIRQIAEVIQSGKSTVMKYYPREARCECGRLMVKHKGWCAVRFAASPARQKVMEKIKRRPRNAK